MAAANTEAAHSNADEAFCDNCFKGFVLEGETKGQINKVGKIDVYTASPSQGVMQEAERSGIVYYPDAFGFGINNHKLIADQIADKTGIKVFVVDILEGDPAPREMMLPAEPMNHLSSLRRSMKMAGVYAGIAAKLPIMWPYKHRESVISAIATKVLSELKASYNLDKIGVLGFCLGGVQSTLAAGSDDEAIKLCVIAHPGKITRANIQNIRRPTCWIFAEDDIISGEMNEFAVLCLNTKRMPAEFKTYPGTTHGFAARPNMSLPRVKAAYEQASLKIVDALTKALK